MSTIENCAVFHSGSRRFVGVNAAVTEDEVIVQNRLNGGTIATFKIVDTAKSGEAWDVHEEGIPDRVIRLVAQTGCGCSGMRPVTEDPEYIARKATK